MAVLTGLLGLLLPTSARGEDVDGETPLVYDLVEASLCDGVASCGEIEFAEIDLPPVYTVDFAARRLALSCSMPRWCPRAPRTAAAGPW